MISLRNLPITRKLMLVISITCGAAVIVAAGALCLFQLYDFRRTFREDLSATAEMLGDNSTAALAFQNKSDAAEVLAAIKAKPHIVQAVLRDIRGNVVAEAGSHANDDVAAFPHGNGIVNDGKHLLCTRLIVLDGREIGRLHLKSDYVEVFWSVFPRYLAVMTGALFLSFLVVVVLSGKLQRVITEPIERLARTAHLIADNKDYSVRATHVQDDEIGLFTDAFNQMLSQIQAQDHALNDSEKRYRLLFEECPLPLWVHDAETLRFLAVNPAAIEKYGCSREQFLQSTVADIDSGGGFDTARAGHTGAAVQARSLLRQHKTKSGKDIAVEITSNALTFGGRAAHLVLVNDVTERLRAERELAAAQRRLVEASRAAGMAEIATGVLHNVGNVLNSVNVSATLVRDRMRESKVDFVSKCAALIQENEGRLAEFLGNDPKGKAVPGYLIKLAGHLIEEKHGIMRELQSLTTNIEHIKEVVAMQQSYARVSGCIEHLPVVPLVEDALAINASSLERYGVEVVREFHSTPDVSVDRHKVLQILVNLISNAKAALIEPNIREKRLTLRTTHDGNGHVAISITDTGIGIPRENLTRIFQHGFTTKKHGHGFGLHSGALAAAELGGELSAHSEGPGHGATFTLTLPISSATDSESHGLPAQEIQPLHT